jgi:hypothetical protein
MPSGRRARRTSRAKRMRAGGWSGTVITTAASLAGRWIGQLQKLLIDVQARRIDVIVVYKVDRLTGSTNFCLIRA